MSENESKRGHGKRNLIVGIIITLFAVIGFITVASKGIGAIGRLFDKKTDYSEYENMLLPVVMNDPDPFDDILNANRKQLISISIWSYLKSNPNPNKVEYNREGKMIIPASVVEEYYKNLFGSDTSPIHQNVDAGDGVVFEYDEKHQRYLAPVTGIDELFTPEIVSVKEKASSLILTVGYLSTSDWSVDSKGNLIQPAPSKYMKITLRKNADSYFIASIKNTDALEEATSETAPETEEEKDKEEEKTDEKDKNESDTQKGD